MKNRTPYQCFCKNGVTRGVIVCVPLAVFLMISVAYLKRGTDVTSTNSRNLEQPKMVPRRQREISPTFPLVDEFELGPKIKKFNNENARVIGFPVKDRKREQKTSSTKIIHLATKFFETRNLKHYYVPQTGNTSFTRYQCPVHNCFATTDPSRTAQADAVLFHVHDLEVLSIPSHRTPEQIWILYSMEPPWLELKDMRRFNGLFNWTMSYRRNSDVTVKYGFIGRQRRTQKEKNHPGRTANQKMDRAVWLVSNCNTDSNREEYVQRLRKIYPVDVIGGCGKEGCRPAETKKCYTETTHRYKFYLAFENAICEDYVTEKMFNPLDYFVIPVTLGGADYSTLTPKNSVINAMEFQTPEELGGYLWEVSRNESLYLSYFEWKDTYRSYLQPWMCDLCEALHGAVSSKTNYDLERWWYGGRPCLRWTTTGFEPVKQPRFPKYHTRIFA